MRDGAIKGMLEEHEKKIRAIDIRRQSLLGVRYTLAQDKSLEGIHAFNKNERGLNHAIAELRNAKRDLEDFNERRSRQVEKSLAELIWRERDG